MSDKETFMDKFEANFEQIEKNRKTMREGREAVATFRLLGLLKDENCGKLRKWDRIP
tara:strand:+ start:775 stop:945 length:171 start_codon:yes stop_codon:yes gene_type:complete